MAGLKTKPQELDIRSPVYEADVVDFDGHKPHGAHKPQKSFRTTRKAIHRGVEIKIHTTYRIEIGGEPLLAHVMVRDDGTVHCHGLPNYSFGSAVDMARAVVEAASLARYNPDDLTGPLLAPHDHGSQEPQDGDGNGHGGHH